MMKALDLFRLDGRVAIVTGGAKGIGMFYSEALADAGARVVVADIDSTAVSQTSGQLADKYPDQILGVSVDITERDSIDAMIGKIRSLWGEVDILVNNAAYAVDIPFKESAWDTTDEEFDRVMAVNVRGTFACTRGTLPLMTKGWGRIINVSSFLAFMGYRGYLMHYAASKAALISLTRSMAAMLGKDGITVNAIAPGTVDSPTLLAQQARRAQSPTASVQASPLRALPPKPIDRNEVPEDLIGTLLYLVSPASDFVTGQTIVVDGGQYFH